MKFFFFATFPSSAVRALRARTPGTASAHARVFFDISRNFFFSQLFHLPRSGSCAHVPPAPPVRMRENFSTFREIFFFRNFSIFRGPCPARTYPRHRQCACASIFRHFVKFFFSQLFHLPRSGPCAHVPPAPSVRMRENFSTFREIFFFRNFSIFRGPGPARTYTRHRQCACARIFRHFVKFFFSQLFHLPRSGSCAHVPPAPPVRMRENFSTFREIFFFATFPSSAVRALRARTPGTASAHARVFFDIS